MRPNRFLVLMATTTLLTLATMVLAAPADRGVTRDQLWRAICQVESGGDPRAHHPGEDARGIAQIRPIMVKDVNRILGEDRYRHDDAYDPTKAREMFDIFTTHYYPHGTAEQWARAWNGGPKGPTKPATAGYWQKVKQHLE